MSVLKRLVPIVLALMVVALVIAVVQLSRTNQFPGSPDAKTTMHIARNLVTGNGFVSDFVCQHARVYPIPHDPTHRKPGAPYLMAAAFKLMGVTLAAPVILNGVLLLGLCGVLWWALAWAGVARWYRALAAVLLLVSHNYELLSFWNTGALSICAATLLALMAGLFSARISMRVFITLAALIGALGFYLKPTFIVTLGACVLFALSAKHGALSIKTLWRGALGTSVCVIALVVLTAPYWLTNLLRHGTPLYSVQPLLRLAERYHLLPHGTFQTLCYDNVPSYGGVIAQLGGAAFLKMEVGIWYHGLKSAIGVNPVLWALAAVGIVLTLNRRNLIWYASGILAMTSTFLFPTFYFAIEDRYYWPMYPCLLFIVGLVVREYSAPPVASAVPADPRLSADSPRVSLLFLGMLALALLYNISYALPNWTRWQQESQQPVPDWVSHVRALPADALVLTDDPWSVVWFAERPAIITPKGAPDAVRAAIRPYGPSHVLTISHSMRTLPFAQHEFTLIARGQETRGNWFLYALTPDEAPVATENMP